ncbi:hypothetical protein ACQQ2N_00375 [Dokdonella sp. MW10]|uniref:hypothetical protein n=1 Tax=Dokdonella sp. MW10 TaxID=2992926 RepID=UPI003F7DF8ED
MHRQCTVPNAPGPECTTTAAGAAGNVANQAMTSDGPIDTKKALIAGGVNAAGMVAGQVLQAPAKALTTTTVTGNPGLPVTSLRGRVFRIGAEAAEEFPDEASQYVIQDVSGEIISAAVDKKMN